MEQESTVVDQGTLEAYEAGATTYAARGSRGDAARACALVAAVGDGLVLDLGCGTGNDLPHLGPRVIGIDPAAAMLAEAHDSCPAVPLVRAEAGVLPLRPGSLGGAWASKSLQHVPAADLPLALADLHRSMAVGAPLDVRLFVGEGTQRSDGDIPGRLFAFWTPERFADLVRGAGFVDVEVGALEPTVLEDWTYLRVRATRGRTLADTVGPDMRLLVCGLNPSLHAADAGVGYTGPNNRFWTAIGAAGLLPEGTDRDPWRLLRHGRIGMTDLVKRATPRAEELEGAEYRSGLERLDRLCGLLAPEAVLLVGLAGWRACAGRRAEPGWQARHLGPSPVYVMPSTSGLNAGTSLASLVSHLRKVAAGPPRRR